MSHLLWGGVRSRYAHARGRLLVDAGRVDGNDTHTAREDRRDGEEIARAIDMGSSDRCDLLLTHAHLLTLAPVLADGSDTDGVGYIEDVRLKQYVAAGAAL